MNFERTSGPGMSPVIPCAASPAVRKKFIETGNWNIEDSGPDRSECAHAGHI